MGQLSHSIVSLACTTSDCRGWMVWWRRHWIQSKLIISVLVALQLKFHCVQFSINSPSTPRIAPEPQVVIMLRVPAARVWTKTSLSLFICCFLQFLLLFSKGLRVTDQEMIIGSWIEQFYLTFHSDDQPNRDARHVDPISTSQLFNDFEVSL